MSAPEKQSIEGRIAAQRVRGVPPSFYAPWNHDPLLMVADRLIGPVARLLALFSPDGKSPPPVRHTRELVLVERETLAVDTDVVSFVFAHPNGAALRPWRPGAHLDLVLPSGLVRQYSLCGDPADVVHYRIAVRRIPNGSGSVELHDALRPGARVGVRGPRNAFPFAIADGRESLRRMHFVAGGIGITPILGMVRAADRAGVDWSMVYTGRHRAALPFLDELARYGDRVVVRTDDVDGLPTGADLVPRLEPGIAVYCCGPVPMLDAVAARVARAPDVEFHYERFTPPPIHNGAPFTVQLGCAGPVLDVPADRSVLDVVAEVVPAVPYSCRQGFCTTCKHRVLAGTVDHRDTVLEDAQRSQGDMLICVSRAPEGMRLVLDIDPTAALDDRASRAASARRG